jgi:hypothetical protein
LRHIAFFALNLVISLLYGWSTFVLDDLGRGDFADRLGVPFWEQQEIGTSLDQCRRNSSTSSISSDDGKSLLGGCRTTRSSTLWPVYRK